MRKITLAIKKYILRISFFFIGAVLTACGEPESETTLPEKIFRVDSTEKTGIASPVQVICNQKTAWVITAAKNDYIYKITYESGKANIEKVEWNPNQGQCYMINIAGQDGWLYAEVWNKDKDRIEILKYHTDGGWDEVIPVSIEKAEDYAVVGSGFYVDKNENMYLVNKDTVTCFNNKGMQVYTYELKGDICFFQENGEGHAECIAADKDGITCYVLSDGPAEQKWTCEVSAEQIHVISANESETVCLAMNQELLFLDGESGAPLARTDLVKMGLSSLHGGYYDAKAGLLTAYGPTKDGKELQSVLLYENDAQADRRTQLIYGMVGDTNADPSTSIWKAITTFNQENEDYYVAIKNYNNMDQLNAELAIGEGPDIIDMTYINYYETYAKKGYLEDLLPYLEQSQYREDIIWNVLDSYKTDGGLYVLIPQFQVEGLLIHPQYAPVVNEWDNDMFFNLIEQNDWKLNIYSANMGNAENLLYHMLFGRQDEFIDWERKEAAFESQEFMDMLMLCKEYREAEWPDTSDWMSEEYYRNTLCMPAVFGGGFENYLSYTNIYGRDYQIYGYPTNSGQVYGINACYDSCAIYSGSKQKEGAWEFLESLLWDENQRYFGMANPGFPIRSSVLKEVEQEEATLRMNGKDLTMTEHEKKMIDDIIYNGQVRRMLIDPEIWNVVQEEVPYYFSGEKSVEETAEMIQSRVQIILQE